MRRGRVVLRGSLVFLALLFVAGRAESQQKKDKTKAAKPSGKKSSAPSRPRGKEEPGASSRPLQSSAKEGSREKAGGSSRPLSPSAKAGKLPGPPSRHYRIRLATMGPGNWLFTYFGHNALGVYYRRLRREYNYNFGTFSVSDPWKLLNDYLQFRLQYWLSVERAHGSLYRYRHFDRTYQIQELFLTAREAQRLVTHLRRHALPQNKHFPYHHYTNNCSTKIRDALHLALGPIFKKIARQRPGKTYRYHVRRSMQPNKITMLLMDFGMGPYADRPLTLWEEMFLPEFVQQYVADPVWRKVRGKELAGPIQTLYQRKGSAPWRWRAEWIFGGWILLWLLLGVVCWRGRWFRRWLRTVFFGLALLGLLLAFMMFLTRMPEPPQNANLLLHHPLLWVLWWMMRKKLWVRPAVQRFLRWALLLHVVTGACYLLLKATGLVPLQTNIHFILGAMALYALGAVRLWTRQDPPELILASSSGKSKKAAAKEETEGTDPDAAPADEQGTT